MLAKMHIPTYQYFEWIFLRRRYDFLGTRSQAPYIGNPIPERTLKKVRLASCVGPRPSSFAPPRRDAKVAARHGAGRRGGR